MIKKERKTKLSIHITRIYKEYCEYRYIHEQYTRKKNYCFLDVSLLFP